MFSSYENKCICWGTSTLRLHIKQHYVLEYWDSDVSWTLAWLTPFESSLSARRRLSQNQYNILTRRLRGNTLSKTINFHSFILTGLRSHPRVCVGEEIAWYMLRHKCHSILWLCWTWEQAVWEAFAKPVPHTRPLFWLLIQEIAFGGWDTDC